MRIFLFSVLLPLYSLAQGSGTGLSRYEAWYTPIYSDDIETIGPALPPGFVFGPGGSFSSNRQRDLRMVHDRIYPSWSVCPLVTVNSVHPAMQHMH